VEDGLPDGRRRFAVAVVIIGTVMAVLDGSVANVALPTIARELRADAASSIWVVNAYQVVVAMMILPLSSLGDKIGYRRVYAAGIALFTLGSLACALSTTLLVLVLSRVVQGIGGAAVMSIAPALMRTIFPSRMLGVAVGISALTVASSAAAGPTIGGAILAFLPWPWLFAINVPIGAFDTAFAVRSLPRQPGTGGSIDILSALLAAPAIALFIMSLDGVARHFPPALTLSLLGGSVVAGFLFVRRQREIPSPMLPLELFAQRRFSLAAATSLLSFVAQGIAFVVLPFVFQLVDGYGALQSGLLFTPWPLTIAFIAPIAGRLSDRYHPPLLSTIGLATLATGLAMLALLPVHPGIADVVWRAVLCGLGFGFFQAPNNRELLGSAPRNRSGAAAGVLATVRVTGQSVGAAFVAVALGTLAAAGAQHVVPNAAALDEPARIALWTSAACAAAACAVSALRLRRNVPTAV
jgi:DHA2 family multidrug resistance protein-like MFS transporter